MNQMLKTWLALISHLNEEKAAKKYAQKVKEVHDAKNPERPVLVKPLIDKVLPEEPNERFSMVDESI